MGNELIRGDGSLEWYMRCCEAYQHRRKAKDLEKQMLRWQELQEMIEDEEDAI